MMLPAFDMNGEHGSACEDTLQQQLIRNLRADLLARFDDCDFRPLVDRNGRDLSRSAYDRGERVHQARAENGVNAHEIFGDGARTKSLAAILAERAHRHMHPDRAHTTDENIAEK